VAKQSVAPKPVPAFDWAELDHRLAATAGNSGVPAGTGFTALEYAKQRGTSGEGGATRRRVRRMVNAGIIRKIGIRSHRDSLGRMQYAPVYDFVEEEPK